MYYLWNKISYILRFVLCFITIEKFPLFGNIIMQFAYGSLVYTILWAVTFLEVRILSDGTYSDEASIRALLYLILYIPNMLVLWFFLWILTKIGIVPF